MCPIDDDDDDDDDVHANDIKQQYIHTENK